MLCRTDVSHLVTGELEGRLYTWYIVVLGEELGKMLSCTWVTVAAFDTNRNVLKTTNSKDEMRPVMCAGMSPREDRGPRARGSSGWETPLVLLL